MSRFRPRAPRAASDSTASSGPARRAHLLAMLGLVAFTFAQRPGRTTFDTKFDLTADPGAFLSRTLHLWNPELSFGELQNQAYGYLFPQGTFFLLGDLAGLPDWIVQRAWSALILLAAYEGARRLMRALRPEATDGWVPLIAGLAFALSPRLLGLSGVLSAEILPTAVLPWVVLPLVRVLQGHYSPRFGALLSGVAVLFMGGVNAVEDLAALPLPALLIGCALGSAVGRRLAGWWVLAVSLACAWWLLPLLVLGRYSPPFLDYIETSTATTHPLGWVNATRGADHWLAFINVGGQPWWPGAFDLATSPHLIALTAVVAALSLAGLFHPSMPGRLPLALSALLGLFLLTLAHVAPYASPLSETMRELLDGALAPLRNVHKVDPIIRLPLALGFAHGTGALLAAARTPRRARPWVAGPAPRAVALTVVIVLLASAQPLFERTLRKPGWTQVPAAWTQATDYLAAHADGRRALVLPGSGFGQQTWGWTIDEPIQGLARSPWVTRSQVPLVPGATIRFLDAIEDRVADGRGSDVLADVLARSGVGFVVVRRDLDLFASGAPSPARVDQAIDASPGLRQVAHFGSTGLGDQAAITIHQVERPVDRVEAVNADAVAAVYGGPEDVFTLIEQGALGPHEPSVIDPDLPPDLVGDGYRLRERQFGRLRDSLSQVMTPAEDYRNRRRAHDYPGVAGVGRVSADYPAIEALSASSSSGYADALGAIRPELGPYAAVDGLTGTYWRSAPLEDPNGQWLELALKDPQPLTSLDLTLGVDGFSGVPIRRVEVRAGGIDGDQVSEHDVDPASGVVRVPLSGAPVSRIRVTVRATFGSPEYGVVAIREIALPGLELGRSLDLPDAGASGATGFVFRAQPERRACVGSALGRVCEVDEARPSEEQAGLVRSFRTDASGRFAISGTVVARSAPATGELLWPLGEQVRVGASSVLTDDPSVSGQFAFDADPSTSWLSARGDPAPVLTLRWERPRTIDRIQVLASPSASRAPARVILQAGSQTREVSLTEGSLGYFAPVRTAEVTLRFPVGEGALPVGIGDLVIDGLEDLAYAPDPDAVTGAECGLGPDVLLDGATLRTRVTGTLADVIDGRALQVEACDGPLTLAAGVHRLRVPVTDRFQPTTLRLSPTAATRRPAPVARDTEILRWESTDRSVRVGPGAEALLRIPENVNGGWRATLDGKRLEATAIDGWQQAYRVPAGEGGVVRLVYTPDTPYRLMLLIGALAALALLLAAAAAGLADRGRVRTLAPMAVAGAVPGGRFGLGALAAVVLLGGWWPALGLLVGLAVGAAPGRAAALRAAAAAGLIAASGVAAGVVAHVDDRAVTSVPDAVAGAAVGLLAATLLRERRSRRAS